MRQSHVPDPTNPLFCIYCKCAIEGEENHQCTPGEALRFGDSAEIETIERNLDTHQCRQVFECRTCHLEMVFPKTSSLRGIQTALELHGCVPAGLRAAKKI